MVIGLNYDPSPQLHVTLTCTGDVAEAHALLVKTRGLVRIPDLYQDTNSIIKKVVGGETTSV